MKVILTTAPWHKDGFFFFFSIQNLSNEPILPLMKIEIIIFGRMSEAQRD